MAIKGIPQEVKEKAEIALKVTRCIKAVLESPVADIITAIIPTDIDDRLKTKAIAALGKVIDRLENPTLESLIEELKRLPDTKRNALLIKIASLLTAELDGNELKENKYDSVVQLVLSSTKEDMA